MEEIAAIAHKTPKERSFFKNTLKAGIQSVSFSVCAFTTLTLFVHVQ